MYRHYKMLLQLSTTVSRVLRTPLPHLQQSCFKKVCKVFELPGDFCASGLSWVSCIVIQNHQTQNGRIWTLRG